MARPTRSDPLEGIGRLLVDANNLLHAIRRGPDPAPAATLVGRLRGVIPGAVTVELVFDGPPDPGSRGRIAAGVRTRYAGTRTADALLRMLLDLVGPPAPGDEPSVLVVTDDRELRGALHARGARTIGTSWLIARLDRARLEAPSVGRRRPPASRHAPGAGPSAEPDDDRRPGWHAGRGATRKTGNPRRAPKGQRRRDRPAT